MLGGKQCHWDPLWGFQRWSSEVFLSIDMLSNGGHQCNGAGYLFSSVGRYRASSWAHEWPAAPQWRVFFSCQYQAFCAMQVFHQDLSNWPLRFASPAIVGRVLHVLTLWAADRICPSCLMQALLGWKLQTECGLLQQQPALFLADQWQLSMSGQLISSLWLFQWALDEFSWPASIEICKIAYFPFSLTMLGIAPLKRGLKGLCSSTRFEAINLRALNLSPRRTWGSEMAARYVNVHILERVEGSAIVVLLRVWGIVIVRWQSWPVCGQKNQTQWEYCRSCYLAHVLETPPCWGIIIINIDSI